MIMARAKLAAIALSFVFLAGCSNSEVKSLRASVAKYRVAAQKAEAKAKTAAAQAEKQLAEAAELSRQATAQLEEARQEREAGLRAHTEANAVLANAYAVQAQNEVERDNLAVRIKEAQQTIDEAAAARVELANSQLMLGELRELATTARNDRKAAEQLKQDAIRIRAMIAAETAAATAEQHAATAAIEAARLERSAAEDAVEAAKLAKEEIVRNRASLDQERQLLAAARDEVDQKAASASAMLAKAEAKRAAAEQLRVEAARQQLLLAEQLVAFEAVKEAAAISELAAHHAWALSAAERKSAEKTAANADTARKDAAASFDYVRSVLQQLRETWGGSATSQQGQAESSAEADLTVAEHSGAIAQ
jgi:chromosome segregation protein